MRVLLITCASFLALAPAASAAIRLTQTPAEVTNVNQATFEFSSDSSIPPSGYSCSLDGDDRACSSPQTYNGLGAGEHVFTVRSMGGLTSEASAYSWRIDTRPPGTSIVDQPAAVVREHSAQFRFEADEVPSRIECRLDGSVWLPCPASLDVPRVSDGAHTLQARAVDEAGNRDRSPASASWVVDGAAPTVRVEVVARARRGGNGDANPVARLLNPAGGRSLLLPRDGLLVRGQATDASRVARVEVALQRAGTCRFFDGRRALKHRPCSEPRWLAARLSGSSWAYRLAAGARIPRGTYRLLVRARDVAGNAASAYTLREVTSPRATLRVLTFNVTGGPMPGPAFKPANVAAVISAHNADVIALQEVCSWAVEQLVVRLAGSGYQYYAHLPAVADVPDSRENSPGGCDYGNALISRLPLSRPATRSGSWLVPPPRCKYFSSQNVFPECRLVTGADVVPVGYDRAVRISSVQIGPDRDPLQSAEISALAKLAARGPDRAIVLGDFNLEPSDTRLEGMRAAGFRLAGGAPTYPFTSFETPYLQIDGIFVRGRFRYSTRAINPTVCSGGKCEPISDHRALVSTITLL